LSSVFVVLLFLLQFSHVSNAQENEKLLTLEEAYGLAMKTQERIKIAEMEVDKSKFLPKKAVSVMLPYVSIDGGYTELSEAIEYETYAGTELVVSPKNQWLGVFQVSQPIFQANFFPLRRQAFQTIERNTEDYYQVVQEVFFDVAQTYYEVVKSKELVNNAKEIIELANHELDISRIKLKAGEVTEDIVLKSELNLTGAKYRLIENNNHLKLAKQNLCNLIGAKTSVFDVVKPPILSEINDNYETLLDKAFEKRHDYKIALLTLELSKTDIKLMKSKFFPAIEGTWDYYRVDNTVYNQDNEYWTACLKINIPIFERSLRIWELKEKQIARRQARLALEEIKKAIKIEIKDSLFKLETYQSLLENLRKQVELAQKNYDIIFIQFKFGSATSLDLNQALTALDSAKTDLIIRTYDYQLAILNLQKAIGLFAMDYIFHPERRALIPCMEKYYGMGSQGRIKDEGYAWSW
jgi:outer membrane protein